MKITLCGSTRFREGFEKWNGRLTLAGHIVYSLGVFGRQIADIGKDEAQPVYSDTEKQTLDLVHLNKILNSEAIVVINYPKNGQFDYYIGDSTRREIEWAQMQDKKIFYVNCDENYTNSENAWNLLHNDRD